MRGTPADEGLRRRHARARAALMALALVAAGACRDGEDGPAAGDDERPTTTATTTTAPDGPSPSTGIAATIEVDRLFSTRRQLAVGLQNLDAEPVHVVALALRTSLFEPLPLEPRDVVLHPGALEVVAPVAYGPIRCDTGGGARLAVAIALANGTERELPLTERAEGAVARLHARECAAEAVRAAADLRFGDRWERDGQVMTGELVLEQRAPGATVTVEDVAGTVVFTIDADRAPPVLHVDDDAPVDHVEVVVRAERCDAHALVESKKTFVFRTWAAVGDGDAVLVEVVPTGEARAAFDALFASCMQRL